VGIEGMRGGRPREQGRICRGGGREVEDLLGTARADTGLLADVPYEEEHSHQVDQPVGIPYAHSPSGG
jgi:hypothetical protein